YVVGTGATELAGSEAFIIGPDGVMRSLGFLNGQDWSEAFAVTPDGAVAVGMAYTTLLNFDAAYFSSG
ncbi:hypothetical protein, partial [Klebsiella pneumoniae]|uniref:hypothetical protein n=1 Tax=Klebsiella pneumoniae TaxID=573 RepID=UPI0025A0E697